MSRPSTLPDWATNANYGAGARPWNGQPNKNAPSAGVIAEGFDPENPLYADFVNWIINNHALWIDCHDTVLTPTPPVNGVNTPQVLFKDSAGKARHLVSHNGFPGGAVNAFREDWKVLMATTTAGAIAANPLWFVTSAGAPTGTTSLIPTAVYPGNALNIVPLNTTNNKVALATNQQVMHPGCTFASWELKFDFGMDAIGNNGMTYWVGLSGGKDPSAPASGYLWFRKATGDTNWQCEANDGTTTTTVDSTAPPVTEASAMQRMRIEYHGSASPYGVNTALFFINDALVATITTHLPTAAQYMAFAGKCTAGGTGHDATLGTVELNVNRYSTGGTI